MSPIYFILIYLKSISIFDWKNDFVPGDVQENDLEAGEYLPYLCHSFNNQNESKL